MDDHYTLRWATPADHDALADVMFDAVRHGPSRYSEAQRAAWMPEPRRGAEWAVRLAGQAIVMAEAPDGIAGFMSLAPGGYIDLAYIRPASQAKGLFRRLYARIERHAATRGDTRLWVHASLMAQPAFAAIGFTVVAHQSVEIDGERFARAEMEKSLRHGNNGSRPGR